MYYSNISSFWYFHTCKLGLCTIYSPQSMLLFNRDGYCNWQRWWREPKGQSVEWKAWRIFFFFTMISRLIERNEPGRCTRVMRKENIITHTHIVKTLISQRIWIKQWLLILIERVTFSCKRQWDSCTVYMTMWFIICFFLIFLRLHSVFKSGFLVNSGQQGNIFHAHCSYS